ncbi:MAG: NAD(P)-dependent oxidoreductase [Alphaproteobacteria bacterium]|nr:NAD(P)-dependent oxidoreductase [Alphaproteobacteria bacterium]
MKTVLLTGAAGSIGSGLRRELKGVYDELRLADIKAINDVGPGESFHRLDIADAGTLGAAMKGVDGVIHMAGQSVEADWETVHRQNIVGLYNLYEAARIAGVKRIVYPSSNHAVGFYPRSRRVGAVTVFRPDGRYGISKAFGELVAALYADKFGIGSLCIRIGNANDKPIDKRRLSIWVSWRDLAQLVRIGLEHPAIHFEIVYGVSDNERSWFDNATAYQLGYRPQDRAEDYAADVLAKELPEDMTKVGPRVIGGSFADDDYAGDPNRFEKFRY